jgi:hypothetical protein
LQPQGGRADLKIQAETDKAKRNAMIKEAFDLHSADVGHLPLHQQALAWGVGKKVKLVQLADNFMPFKWIRALMICAPAPFRFFWLRSARRPQAWCAGLPLVSYDEKNPCPLARQRCWLQLSHLAHGHGGGGLIALVCVFCSCLPAGWHRTTPLTWPRWS